MVAVGTEGQTAGIFGRCDLFEKGGTSEMSSGKYAVNVLHNEHVNGKIKKDLYCQKKEYVSNFQTIGLGSKSNFKILIRTSFLCNLRVF